MAIEKAIELNLEYINICTNSRSTLSVFESCAMDKYHTHIKHLDPVIKDLFVLILSCISKGIFSIRFSWCPAHKGIKGNESVDELAKKEAVDGSITTNKIEGLNYLQNKYQKLDRAHLEIKFIIGKYYFENFCKFNFKYLLKFNLHKNISGKIITIVSNFAFTNATKHKIGIVDSPSFLCGHEFQDINYIFWNCSLLTKEKKIMIKDLVKQGIQLPVSIEYVLNNINFKIMKFLLKFLATNGKEYNLSL